MKGALVFFCVAFVDCLGYNIDTCNENKQLQVEETRPTVLTCTGITHDRMIWKLRHTDGTESQIGTCTWSFRSCSNTDSSYTLSWTQNSTSQLTIRGDHRNKIAGTVTCAGLYDGRVVNAATCDVRVVYTDYRVTNCQTSVSTTKDWTVSGSCDVNKMFASDGKYSCQWTVSAPGTHGNIILGQLGFTSFTISGKDYRKMTCFFTGQPLPSEDGTYSYTVTIDPAENPNEGHVGKPLIISSAKGPQVLHSCPDYVIEGDDAHCTCQASASEPPAVVTWSSGINDVVSNTSTLTLSNVSRSLNGSNYTCRQYWGGFSTEHMKTVVFTLNVRSTTDDNSDDCGDVKLAAIVGGATGGVAVVIIVVLVIVIVVLWKKRCDPLYAKPSPTREADNHTYTDLDHYQHITPPGQTPTQRNNTDTQRYGYENNCAGNEQLSSAKRQYENTPVNMMPTSPEREYENTVNDRQEASSVGQYENTAVNKK